MDPDTIVGNHSGMSGMSSGPDAEDYLEDDLSQVGHDLDPDLCTPFNVVAVPANNDEGGEAGGLGGPEDNGSGLHSRTMGRLRHLDILEEVSWASLRFFFREFK